MSASCVPGIIPTALVAPLCCGVRPHCSQFAPESAWTLPMRRACQATRVRVKQRTKTRDLRMTSLLMVLSRPKRDMLKSSVKEVNAGYLDGTAGVWIAAQSIFLRRHRHDCRRESFLRSAAGCQCEKLEAGEELH